METFWTIVACAVIFGIGGVAAFVGFYWFVILPDRVLHDHARNGAR